MPLQDAKFLEAICKYYAHKASYDAVNYKCQEIDDITTPTIPKDSDGSRWLGNV